MFGGRVRPKEGDPKKKEKDCGDECSRNVVSFDRQNGETN